MEDVLQIEFPKRNRGRPKAKNQFARPKFKILQYDLTNVSIRTTHANEKTDIVAKINEEIKSNNDEDSNHIIFDGKTYLQQPYNRRFKL